MHSFQPSRGRIFFEVLCAMGIAASCGGAWLQTGASALLASAGVATLYALVHFFDLFRRDPSVAVEPQRIDFTPAGEANLAVASEVFAPEPTVREMVDALELDPRLTEFGEAQVQPVEPLAVHEDEAAPEKAPRKASRRTSGAPKKTKVKQVADTEPVVAEPVFVEQVTQTHVAPLFEPDPFHRMPRQGFGRRGQL
ncbi:hypothetical protein LZ496_11680 [Sphingomonas sp. NSE70-1]|uniref:Uncharacterized protein n=1 Tax=Sphingomonas caseinilyticus TaxID=2908205 RepID=A0ABT0RWN5_9SPHN|nr:hypothetical protein [Sphingomonas caseinilyticus]MCL6699439.1 hypothetical protein [Sphingomonas caseinilyticus]